MDASVWKEVNRIFDGALDLPTAAWDDYVAAESAGNEEVQAEAAKMLAAHKASPSFMETPAPLTHQPSFDTLESGSRVGPYRLVKKLGAGGMGTVHMAVRDDELYEQRVAIKLVRKGMDTESVLARFHNERQILATLDHPNIARLLDGGATPDGQPYLVMEYISGVPIHHYCIQRKLKLRARLRLFRDVCKAVHFAHQNLIIHRDLKPHNILVTKAGVPKLVDFGIAKLIAPEPSLHKTSKTVAGAGPMTPKYAAPEQLKGERVTTATDIYALGVLLYELLTGVSPYGSVMNHRALESAILEKDPRKPSEAVLQVFKNEIHFDVDSQLDTLTGGPADSGARTVAAKRSKHRMKRLKRLSRVLSGDLDNVILMALRKDPTRRYQSVEQFSEDIRRYLVGQTVIARKETYLYLASKFFRRNFFVVSGILMLILILVGFLVETTFHRDQMQVQRDKANHLAMMLVDFYTSLDPMRNPGQPLTPRDLLQTNVPRLEVAFSDQPEMLAMMTQTIGQAYNNMGLYEESGPLLEKALMLRRQSGADAGLLAETLVELAYQRFQLDQMEAAAGYGREALQLLHHSYGEAHPATVDLIGKLALLYGFNHSDPQAMEDLQARGKSLVHRLRGSSFMRGEASGEAAGLRLTLAYLAMARGDLILAREHLNVGLDTLKSLKGLEAPETRFALKNSILLYRLQERPFEAEQQTLQLLHTQRKMLHEGHPSLAQTLMDLGGFREKVGDFRGARTYYEEALSIRNSHLPKTHPDRLESCLRLGIVLAESEGGDRPLRLLREVLENDHVMDEALADPVELHFYMGVALLEKGRTDAAERRLLQGLDLLFQHQSEEGPDHADFYGELGRVHLQRGQLTEAEHWFERALATTAGDGHWDGRSAVLLGLARVCIQKKAFGNASDLLKEAQQTACQSRVPALEVEILAEQRALKAQVVNP